jgi:hypothetical protein
VSFHDIQLALGPVSGLDFMVDGQTYQTKQNRLRWLYYRQSSNRRYANLLHRQCPDLPFGLFMHRHRRFAVGNEVFTPIAIRSACTTRPPTAPRTHGGRRRAVRGRLV